MRITIGGPPGSGKTTVAKLVSSQVGFKHIYTGEIFRTLAKERGISLEDLSKLAEKDESIDIEVDKRQKELGQEENIVLEGRMARFMIEPDLSIWVTAPFDVRVKRLSQRENLSYEEIYKTTKLREESEIKRYKKIYNVDIYNLSAYDLVINSAHWNAEGVSQIIVAAIKNRSPVP